MTVTETSIKVPMKIHRAIAASAHRGAKFLDKRNPDWFQQIRTSDLCMTDDCYCIYGQLEAEDLLQQFAEKNRDVAHTARSCYKNGNDVNQQFGYIPPDVARRWALSVDIYSEGPCEQITWLVLQEEWLREIMVRRATAAA